MLSQSYDWCVILHESCHIPVTRPHQLLFNTRCRFAIQGAGLIQVLMLDLDVSIPHTDSSIDIHIWVKHWRYDLHFWWFNRVGQRQINDNINCAKGIPGVNLHLNLNQALTNPIYNQTQTYLNRITLGLLLRALPLVANYWGLPHRLLQCSLFTNPPFVHHRKYLQTRDKVLWCINSMKVDTIL